MHFKPGGSSCVRNAILWPYLSVSAVFLSGSGAENVTLSDFDMSYSARAVPLWDLNIGNYRKF